MLKKLVLGILLLLPVVAVAQVVPAQNQQILAPYGGFIVATSTSGISKLSATTTPYFANFSASAGTINGNFTVTGTCTGCGSASGAAFPFTATATYNSTSTPIGFLQGAFFTASSTFNSNVFFPNLTAGLAFVGTNGIHSTVATSSLTPTSPLTGTLTVIGNGNSLAIQAASASQAGSLAAVDYALLHAATTTFSAPLVYTNSTNAVTCTNASAGVTGCLTGTDWSTFNNKQATISATWPIILTGATLSFGGLSTSSAAVVGNLPYYSGVNTFANVATGTIAGTANQINTSAVAYSLLNNITFSLANHVIFPAGGYESAIGSTTSATSTSLAVTGTASTSLLYVTKLTPAGLGVDLNGKVYSAATTTYSSGLSYVGGNVTNTGVTSIVAGTGISISGATGAVTVTNAYGYPFTAGTTYNTASQGTTTPIWLQGSPYSLFASSTAVLTYASTTALSAANLVSGNCVQASTGGLLTTAAGACGTGGFAWPWTPTTNYGAAANSTSTPIWFVAGLQASTTNNYFAGLTVVGALNALTTISLTQGGSIKQDVGEGAGLSNLFVATGTSLYIGGDSIVNLATFGLNNTFLGYSVGQSGMTGARDTFVGSKVQQGVIGGGGSDQVALGYDALHRSAGAGNIAIGSVAGNNITTGTYNIAIGAGTNVPTNTASQQLDIGNLLYGTGLYNSTTASAAPVLNGTIAISSTTPWGQLSVHALNGSTLTTLFAIGSSTATATTTLFTVNNVGTASTTGLVVSSAGGSGIRCAQFAADGTISANASACGSGSGVGNWFTGTTWGGVAANSTSTLLLLQAGAVISTSSIGNLVGGTVTATSSLTLSFTTDKSLATDVNGTTYGVATGTVSGTNGITVTAARQALGGALAIDCTNSSVTVAGCISAANFQVLNNKVGTSSNATAGNLAYYTTTNGTPALIADVATGTISASLPLSVTAGRSAIGGAAAFSIANALSDGSTKGAASFTAADFNDSAGNISIDYTNGQAAANTTKGFLAGADFTAFNVNRLSTTSVLTNGQLLVSGAGAAGNTTYSIATSSGSCSSGVSCSAFTVVGSVSPSITNTGVTSIVAGLGISISGATGAVTVTNAYGYPFTAGTTYNTASQGTTTPIWFQGSPFSLFASSTAVLTYASTTAFSASNLVSGNCVQASTGGMLTTTGSACGSGGGSFPFTPDNSFNTVANSTSTLILLTQGLSASTTVRFGNALKQPFWWDSSAVTLGLGTSTSYYGLTIASSSPQLSLSAGGGITQWTFANEGGNLYLSTTTVAGTATSTPAALTINNSGTGLFVGTTTNAAATGLAVNGTGYWTGLSSSAGLQTGILCLSSKNEIINESVACVASSKRFKNNIEPLNTGLDEVLNLKPVSFFFKPEYNGSLQTNPNYNGEQVGFIAEDVQALDPRLTVVEPDGVTAHGVRYEQMTALLVKAIQELNGKIEQSKRSAEENWQWFAIGLLVIWNLALTVKRKR